MRNETLVPFGPDPSWYERYWLAEDSASRTATIHSDLPAAPSRSAALIALVFFSVAAACGAGLEHFHIIYP